MVAERKRDAGHLCLLTRRWELWCIGKGEEGMGGGRVGGEWKESGWEGGVGKGE